MGHNSSPLWLRLEVVGWAEVEDKRGRVPAVTHMLRGRLEGLAAQVAMVVRGCQECMEVTEVKQDTQGLKGDMRENSGSWGGRGVGWGG